MLKKTKINSMARFPCSPNEMTGGMVWFPRMLDKIRLNANAELPPDYTPWLGKGFDARCCRFLRVDYGALVARTLQGGTDEEVLAWCFQVGRLLSNEDIQVWSDFMRKRGLRDSPAVLEDLRNCKVRDGLGDRDDIDTYFKNQDAAEGRPV
jgi:hypothetical protein